MKLGNCHLGTGLGGLNVSAEQLVRKANFHTMDFSLLENDVLFSSHRSLAVLPRAAHTLQ